MHLFMLVYEYILNVPEETKVGGAACAPVVLDHWQLYYAHVEDNPNKGFHFRDSYRFPCGQQTSTRRSSLGDFVGCIPVCLTNQKFPQLMGEEKEEVVHWLCCLIQGCGRAMCTREWWNTWLCIGVCNQSSLLFTLYTFVCSILFFHYLHAKLCSSCISIPTTSLQPLDSSPSSGSDSSSEMSLEHSEELLELLLLLGQNSSSLSGPELQEETWSSALITSVACI